jgi:hypothetical protein
MWKVEYKPDKNSQVWIVLNTYDDQSSAFITASHVSSDCFMVIVKDPEGSVIWSN